MLAGTRAGAAADSNGSETTDTTTAEGAAVLRALSTAEGDGDDDDDDDERGGTGWQRRHQPRQGDDDDDAEWMQEGSFVCRDMVYSVGDCVLVNGDVAYTAEINGKTHHVQEKTDIWITKILAFQRPVCACAHRSHPPSATLSTCVMAWLCENHKRKSQGKT